MIIPNDIDLNTLIKLLEIEITRDDLPTEAIMQLNNNLNMLKVIRKYILSKYYKTIDIL